MEGKKAPEVLYHYCSVHTFYNIIRNCSIWLSDISKSNDSLELKWIKGRCSYYLLRSWIDYAKEVQKLDQHGTIDFEEFDRLHKIVNELIKNETEKCWVFCLSEKQDDLGQWRGYADDGYGISIGFNTSFFQHTTDSIEIDKNDPVSVLFDCVSYSEKEIESFFYNTCELSSITPQMSSEEVISKLRKAVVYSLWGTPFYKNSKFAEEEEWRLVFSILTNELNNGKNPKVEFEKLFPQNKILYDFTIRGSNLISHIEFGDKDMRRNISEIWIGPKCELTTADIKLFLISKGFLRDFKDDSIRIHESNASYR